MKRFNYFLPEQVVARLAVIAELRGVSVSEMVRTALQQYLDSLLVARAAHPPHKG